MTDIAAKCDRNVSGGPLLQSELQTRHLKVLDRKIRHNIFYTNLSDNAFK